MKQLSRDFIFSDKVRPVKVWRMEPQPEDILHFHDFHELVVIEKGDGDHFTQKHEFPVSGGDVFLIMPGVKHSYRNVHNLVLTNILYIEEEIPYDFGELRQNSGYNAIFELEPQLRERHGERNRLRLNLDQLNKVLSLCDAIHNEITQDISCNRLMVATYFVQLAILLSRCYEEIGNRPARELILLDKIIRYIEKRYGNKLTLNSLAKQFGLGRSSLSRLFSHVMGQSPIAYLIGIRIAKASALLASTDLKITEVAFRTGFSDSNYFSRQFKKQCEMTPKEYRQKFRKTT